MTVHHAQHHDSSSCTSNAGWNGLNKIFNLGSLAKILVLKPNCIFSKQTLYLCLAEKVCFRHVDQKVWASHTYSCIGSQASTSFKPSQVKQTKKRGVSKVFISQQLKQKEQQNETQRQTSQLKHKILQRKCSLLTFWSLVWCGEAIQHSVKSHLELNREHLTNKEYIHSVQQTGCNLCGSFSLNSPHKIRNSATNIGKMLYKGLSTPKELTLGQPHSPGSIIFFYYFLLSSCVTWVYSILMRSEC